MATVPPEQRRILTSHDAFFYFGARYGIEFIGVQGIDTESEPSAAAIAALVRQIRAEKVKAVFVENMSNPALVRTVARESGVVLGPAVYSDALSPPGGPADSYLKMFRYNVTQFVKAMRG
jgi:zinc/manganese transport system substrate-binding protein